MQFNEITPRQPGNFQRLTDSSTSHKHANDSQVESINSIVKRQRCHKESSSESAEGSSRLSLQEVGEDNLGISNVASYAIGSGKVLDDLIVSAAKKPIDDIEKFVDLIEDRGFLFHYPSTLERTIKILGEAKLDTTIGELLIYLSQSGLETEEHTSVVIDWVTTLEDTRILTLFTTTVKRDNFISKIAKQYHEDCGLLMPFFLLSNCATISLELISHLIKKGKFDLLSKLVLCVDKEGKKYIGNPFVAIESVAVLGYLSTKQDEHKKVKDLLSTTVSNLSQNPMTLLDAIPLYKEANEFNTELLFSDTEEIKTLVLQGNKLNTHLLNPLALYFLIPELIEVVVNEESKTRFVRDVLTNKAYNGSSLLHNPVLFKLVQSVLLALFDYGKRDTFEKILSEKNAKGAMVLSNEENYRCAEPLLDQLIEEKQFSLLTRLISGRDNQGNTLAHYNLECLVPLLLELVECGEFGVVRTVLLTTNNLGKTPLHTNKNIFKLCKQLFVKIFDKGEGDLLTEMVFSQDKAGKNPLVYNDLQDTLANIDMITLLLKTVVKNEQYNIADQFLRTEISPGNTLINNNYFFPYASSILLDLLEKDQFELVHSLLKKQDSNAFPQIFYENSIGWAFRVFDKLVENEEYFKLLQLFSIENIYGETIVHRTEPLKLILPYLLLLVEKNQFQIIRSLLLKKNKYLATPLSANQNLAILEPLLTKLTEKNQGVLIQELYLGANAMDRFKNCGDQVRRLK